MQDGTGDITAASSPRQRVIRQVTHQPSHHTRILRLLFSGLHAAAPGVAPASLPAAAFPCWWWWWLWWWLWWWWCPFLIILKGGGGGVGGREGGVGVEGDL